MHLFCRKEAPIVGLAVSGIAPCTNRADRDVLPMSASPTLPRTMSKGNPNDGSKSIVLDVSGYG